MELDRLIVAKTVLVAAQEAARHKASLRAVTEATIVVSFATQAAVTITDLPNGGKPNLLVVDREAIDRLVKTLRS
jgi:hypothetical protein